MTDKTETAEDGATNFLAIVPEHKPELVLLDEKARAILFEHIEKEMGERTFDMETATGRDECRSFAAKITKTKTALTATALSLTEAWRKNTAEVNKQRKPVEEKLAELAKKARAPLTAWETAEEERLTRVENTILSLNKSAEVSIEATAKEVENRIASVEAVEIPADVFRGAHQSAQETRLRTLNFLRSALERLKREEADRAELAKLREEAEARRKADEERVERERQAAEAAAKAEREAEETRIAEARAAAAAEAQRRHDEEAAKLAAERAEQARKDAEEAAARAAEKAANDAKREAEARAAAAAAEAQRAADEVLAAEKARAAAAEAQAEAERKERAETDRRRAEAEAAETARREAAERDIEHRRECKRQAKEALMGVGLDERAAQIVVIAILGNEIPRVKLDFSADPVAVTARQSFDEARDEAPEAEAAEHAAELSLEA